MAETGKIKLRGKTKLRGKEPTETECALVRTRFRVFREERLKAEKERLERIGTTACYSEWVKAWNRDTSCEAVQKHFEETGEDENDQLIEMFRHRTDREYRIMMGTDVRIGHDPLAMRMREDQIKESMNSVSRIRAVCLFPGSSLEKWMILMKLMWSFAV